MSPSDRVSTRTSFFVGVMQHQGGIRLLQLLLHEPESGPGDRVHLAVGDLGIEAFQVSQEYFDSRSASLRTGSLGAVLPGGWVQGVGGCERQIDS